MNWNRKSAPPLAKIGDKFRGKRSGKTFTVTNFEHNLLGLHDIYTMTAEDGEVKTVASFRLLWKYERLDDSHILSDREERERAEG